MQKVSLHGPGPGTQPQALLAGSHVDSHAVKIGQRGAEEALLVRLQLGRMLCSMLPRGRLTLAGDPDPAKQVAAAAAFLLLFLLWCLLALEEGGLELGILQLARVGRAL